jgi:HTH-type transcriptional regulator/antitoxin HigA
MNTVPLHIDYHDQTQNVDFHIPVNLLKAPENESEYKMIESYLDKLVDQIRDDENHDLAIIMQIMGDNLERYDDSVHPPIGSDISDIDLVSHLMQANNLQQKDMIDVFGNQGNVSKFLNGDRALSKSQVSKLKYKFKISADLFL